MPIAAVPAYLGQDFKDASPALRFGMLLPIWTTRADQEKEVNKRAQARSREGQETADMLSRQGMDATIRALRGRQRNPLPGLWDKNDFGAREAWGTVISMSENDRRRMDGLISRQKEMAETVPSAQLLPLEALALAPFTTGLGNEHPLENGFAFLNPYGLPYLPGSGVKGVLRQAARELASGKWGETKGWSTKASYTLTAGKETIRLFMLDVLFGLEAQEGEQRHVRGALSFWDVIPQIAGDSLMVEVMTPHQSHYYQIDKKKNPQPPHFQSPHDSGQPNPICFLTVPPGSRFVFHVVCDLAHLQNLTEAKDQGAPDLLAEGPAHWKALLDAAFEHAFHWLGFGAKTAVGYGAMTRGDESSRATGCAGGPQVAPFSAQSASPPAKPAAPSVQTAEEQWTNATLTFQKGGGGVVKVECAQGKADAQGSQAQAILQGLPPEQRRRLDKKGGLPNITVLVTIQGNLRQIKAVLSDG
jgi:CRISPR-associated protein Cmr6